MCCRCCRKAKSVSTTDGYTGTAYLDISSISTKVAGTESVSNDLSATREYPGMTEMDMESIPKSITENGHTLRFADVEWKEANDEADNFGTVQTTLHRCCKLYRYRDLQPHDRLYSYSYLCR